MYHLALHGTILSVKPCHDRVETFYRQCFRFADIGREKFSFVLAVGFPVPSAALIARAFLACREGADGIAKGKHRGYTEPRIPLG